MKNKFIAIMFSYCHYQTSCYPVRYDGPYKGKVDRRPIRAADRGSGRSGVWYKVAATVAGGVSSYYDAQETVTDKNGEFEIKGLGLKILRQCGADGCFDLQG